MPAPVEVDEAATVFGREDVDPVARDEDGVEATEADRPGAFALLEAGFDSVDPGEGAAGTGGGDSVGRVPGGGICVRDSWVGLAGSGDLNTTVPTVVTGVGG